MFYCFYYICPLFIIYCWLSDVTYLLFIVYCLLKFLDLHLDLAKRSIKLNKDRTFVHGLFAWHESDTTPTHVRNIMRSSKIERALDRFFHTIKIVNLYFSATTTHVVEVAAFVQLHVIMDQSYYFTQVRCRNHVMVWEVIF